MIFAVIWCYFGYENYIRRQFDPMFSWVESKWNKSNRCRVVAINGCKRIKRSKVVIHWVFVLVEYETIDSYSPHLSFSLTSIPFSLRWRRTMTVSYLNDNNFYLFSMFWRLLSFRSLSLLDSLLPPLLNRFSLIVAMCFVSAMKLNPISIS